MLLAKRKKKRVIIFVCTGNTCRSPMAQGLMQQILDENNIKTVEVKTAGVLTIPGLLPTQEAVQVMEAAGIDIRRHRSAQLTAEMIRKADLVLGMTPFHVQATLRASELANGKTFLLKEYTKSDLKNFQITDPMGATLEVYKRVFREIKLAIDRLAEMDVAHAPLDQPLTHEKWVPPKPESKSKPAPAPKAEEVSPAEPAPKKAKKKKSDSAPASEKPAKKKAAAKKEASAKKAPAAKKAAPAKKPAAPKKKAAPKQAAPKKAAAKKAKK